VKTVKRIESDRGRVREKRERERARETAKMASQHIWKTLFWRI
jgi:hypothetical protein